MTGDVTAMRTVLVANRGEIALRIIRACRGLGLQTVAVYSDADVDAPYVRAAHEAIRLGPAPARESYLAIERVVDAARGSGADALHPGYGFLSENWRLAAACEAAGLTFVGPPAAVIRAMGDKAEARRRARDAGVPVLAGSSPVTSPTAARAAADAVGYPVMLKAVFGGGGIGMSMVAEPERIEAAFVAAQRRARVAFGEPLLYVERALDAPRHVEVQVMADHHGRVVHLHDRECSIQRRHQKLLEEGPAPALDSSLRQELHEAACRVAEAVGYRNAGTIEFLVEDRRFYFLEMNARLQVEHPVTEEMTGLDLVQAQLRIASGEPLAWRQEDIVVHRAAIECRIYAEDPDRGFLPSPGVITGLRLPTGPGVRHECGVEVGSVVTVHYDPLVAKVIASAPQRHEAIDRLAAVLDDYRLDGVHSTLPLHRRILASPTFRAGAAHTRFLERGL